MLVKAGAPAAAEELALLPAEPKSRRSCLSLDTILMVCSSWLDEGGFEVCWPALRLPLGWSEACRGIC